MLTRILVLDSSQVQHVASTLNLANTSLSLPAMQRTTQTKAFTFAKTTRILSFGLTSEDEMGIIFGYSY